MRSLPACKTVGAISPLLVDNASATAIAVDSANFKFGRFVVYLGATDIALTALKLTECDTSGGSYDDVTGCIIGTSTDSAGAATTLPSATDDGKFYMFDVTMGGPRKRYFKIVATAGDGTLGANIAAWCDLYGGSIVPSTATTRGAAVVCKA